MEDRTKAHVPFCHISIEADFVVGLDLTLLLFVSDIVRMALERFIGEVEEKKEETPYERVKDLIGSFSSGLPDLGESHRKYLIERIKKNAKYPA